MKPINLKITTKYDRPDRVITIHENLPVFPSYSIVVGAGSSGKTLMLVNLLHKIKSVFRNNFIIFTQSSSRTMEECCAQLGGAIYDSIEDPDGVDRIHQVMNYQKSQKRQGFKLRPVLIILDDYADAGVFDRRNSSVASVYYRGRHNNISIITTTQYYKRLPKPIRSLSHYKMLYRPMDTIELMGIAEENHLWMSQDDFISLMNRITSEPYAFLMIDSKKMKMQRNFEDVVSKFKKD